MNTVIGENIRQARLARQWSLADVAKKAKVSIATLSRIENNKQNLELGMFLTLARVLERPPDELLGQDRAGDGPSGLEPLVKKIAAFETNERANLWRELAFAQRTKWIKARRRLRLHHLALHLDEMLAQIDLLREELESVRKRLGHPSR